MLPGCWFACAASAPFPESTAFTFTVEPGDSPLQDYLGVIAGPMPDAPGDCGYTDELTLPTQLQALGVHAVRNNDQFDDTLDLDLLLDCSGTPYGSDEACGGEYPCWKGCVVDDCGALAWDAGRPGGLSSDERFDATVAAGFEPFLRLGSEYRVDPTLLAEGVTARTVHGPQDVEEEANWLAAARCEAERYVARGPVRYVDLLTETTAPYWSRSWTDYDRFWIDAWHTLRPAVGQDVKLGGAGMWGEWTGLLVQAYEDPTVCATADELPARDFLAALAHAGIRPDWLGVHVFSPRARDFARVLDTVQALLAGTGDCFGPGGPQAVPWPEGWFADTELVVDAFDAAALDLDGASVAGAGRFFDDADGAALVAAAFVTFEDRGVTRAFQYRAADTTAVVYDGITACDADATPKPRARVYAFWDRMMGAGATVGTRILPEDGEGLWMLAADAPARTFLFVANTGEDDVSYTPGIGTRALSSFGSATVRTIDADDDGTTAVRIDGDTLTIAPATVQLVEVEGP